MTLSSTSISNPGGYKMPYNNEELRISLKRNIVEIVDFYRGLILDLVEQDFGKSPTWPYLRGRLLKALGDRGLLKRIQEVLDKKLCSKGGSHD